MATVVYQGLQSCLESHLAEPRALRLRLSSPNPRFSHQPLELVPLKSSFPESNGCIDEGIRKKTTNCPQDKLVFSSKPDLGARSFLQALSCSPTVSKDCSYVHPLVKHPSSVVLSEKSLALCTENLGNETGTDVVVESNVFSLTSSEEDKGNPPTREARMSRQVLKSMRGNGNRPSFPPPLTTMRGSESIQVRSHREDGRLVIQARRAPSEHARFQAERSDGRLRLSLCLFKDSPSCFDYEENQSTELENDMDLKEEEKDSLSEDEEGLVDGTKMGMEKLQRPGRCVEGENDNRGLFDREPSFLVSTS